MHTRNTLRLRLAAWNALVVILTALVTVLGTRQGVLWAVMHEIDQVLIEDSQEVALALRSRPAAEFDALRDELTRKAMGHRQHRWFVQLFDPGGRPIWNSDLTPAALEHVPPHPDGPTTLGGVRYLDHTVATTKFNVASIRVGGALTVFHEEMARINRLVFITSLCALVTAPLVGYWLAARTARALGAIISSAARLRPSHMEERLPVRGTGDELDQLAITVNSLLDRIAIYLAEKRDFLANAAHELRTPLAAIHSSVEVALASDRTQAEYQELLVEIIDQGAALETLVNQLLLISETEAEQLQPDFQPVPLDVIVRKSAEMFSGVAEARQLTLRTGPLQAALVPGNRQHLRQLVNNLLDNAIKYTPAGGEVQVQLERDDEHGVAMLTVRDTGIGIAADDVPRVFDRFFRVDRARTKLPESVGSGLGLSLCQAVVTSHHGQIICQSELGKGTTFLVTLPLSPRDG